MNWEVIGAMGEVLGALAVFLTLIYLAAQVRQHTKLMDENRKVELSRNAQMRTENRLMMQLAAIENEHVRNAVAKMRVVPASEIVKKLDELSHDEYESYRHYLMMQALIIENMWYQGQEQLIDASLTENIVPAITNFGHIWKEMGMLNTLRADFRMEVDRILGETDA